jgi:hypothetical protein
VPVNQGIFVHDTTTRATRLVARTNTGVYEDFLFWVFSGRQPGVGGGDDGGDDQEPPRWRSSAFVASAAWAPDISKYNVAFKALKSVATGLTGIYLTRGPGNSLTTYDTAVDTTTAGTAVDPEAPSGSVVATVGIEREGLRRNSWLAINASMVDPVTTESIAGVYVTKVPRILP